MIYLKEATASQTVQLGPFVDDTDGKTAETGLTIANTDIKVNKGATTQTNKNSGGATHIASGWYYATLDATDTDTVGRLQITVNVAGALPVKLDCFVLDAATYDAFVTGLFPANVTQISGDTTAADNLELAADGTGYNLGGGDITVSSVGTVLALDGDAIAAVADGVWDEALAGHTTAGTGGKVLADAAKETTAQGILDHTGTTGVKIDSTAQAGLVTAIWASATRTLTSFGTLASDVWAVATRTLTSVADSSGITTLLSRIVGTLAAGTHNAQSGDAYARLGAPAGASVSADIAAVKGETATIVTDTNELQTDWANGGRLDVILDARASTAHVQEVEDKVDLLDVTTTATSGKIDLVKAQTDLIPASPAAVGSAMTLANDAISAAALAADAIAEISAAVESLLSTSTRAELAAVPAANASLVDKLTWLAMLARNAQTQTETTGTLMADDGTTPVATAAMSDDGTTFTSGEWTTAV